MNNLFAINELEQVRAVIKNGATKMKLPSASFSPQESIDIYIRALQHAKEKIHTAAKEYEKYQELIGQKEGDDVEANIKILDINEMVIEAQTIVEGFMRSMQGNESDAYQDVFQVLIRSLAYAAKNISLYLVSKEELYISEIDLGIDDTIKSLNDFLSILTEDNQKDGANKA
jgi:hypothetical protein